MGIPTGILVNGFDAFLLVFVRMTSLFVIAPIFGRKNIPVYLKIGFSLMLSFILIGTVNVPKIDYMNSIYGFALVVFKEFIVGITLGYVSYMIFTAIYLAGQIIDMQVGFGIINVIDPVSNIQVPVTSNFYFIFSMLVFLTINGHHMLIKALFNSYKLVPAGGAVFSADLMNDIIKLFGDTFSIAFRICAPILAAILITDVALGVILKAMPQMNVFVIGMPLKIFIGIYIMIITIPAFIGLLDIMVNGVNSGMLTFLKDMAPK